MTFRLACLFAGAVIVALGAHAQSSGPLVLSKDEGVIQQLDFNASTMIVSGLRYQVASAATVTVQGSFGAMTMLQTGMKVKFTYWRDSDAQRIVVALEQLPDSTHMDEN